MSWLAIPTLKRHDDRRHLLGQSTPNLNVILA